MIKVSVLARGLGLGGGVLVNFGMVLGIGVSGALYGDIRSGLGRRCGVGDVDQIRRRCGSVEAQSGSLD